MRRNLRLICQISQGVQTVKINVLKWHTPRHIEVVVGVKHVYRGGRLRYEIELNIISRRVYLLERGNWCAEVCNFFGWITLRVCIALVQIVVTREEKVIAFIKFHIHCHCFFTQNCWIVVDRVKNLLNVRELVSCIWACFLSCAFLSVYSCNFIWSKLYFAISFIRNIVFHLQGCTCFWDVRLVNFWTDTTNQVVVLQTYLAAVVCVVRADLTSIWTRCCNAIDEVVWCCKGLPFVKNALSAGRHKLTILIFFLFL